MTARTLVLERYGAMFERHTYQHDGLELVAWIIRPPGTGPFPLLVYNHGSNMDVTPDGTLVSLLAASERPYGAVVAQASGVAYGQVEVPSVSNAAARITAPVLFQHMRTDTLVPPERARAIFDWSHRFRPLQRWRDYPGAPGIEGHYLWDPANLQQLRSDYVDAIREGFATAPTMPENPPEHLRVRDFLFPDTLRHDIPRWVGRFGEDGPEVIVAMDGNHLTYCWKDPNSRGYRQTVVIRRENSLLVELWPGFSFLLEPLPQQHFSDKLRMARATAYRLP